MNINKVPPNPLNSGNSEDKRTPNSLKGGYKRQAYLSSLSGDLGGCGAITKINTLIELIIAKNPNITEERNSKHLPLDLLILLILNQSTSDILADKAFENLKKYYTNYENILKENNILKLQESIKICGLSATKAQYIFNALNYLKENNGFKNKKFDENLTYINNLSDEEALKFLTQIKGVGIKSASCLLMFSFGRGTFPIDTHLFRVFKRINNIIPPNASLIQAHKLLQTQINGQNAFIVHVALIELGRNICHAPPKKPLCEKCYLNSICDNNKLPLTSGLGGNNKK